MVSLVGSSIINIANIPILLLAVPIAISLLNGRKEVSQARWNCGPIIGPIVNVIALAWIAFELVLFSMPTALPVTSASMNYASVIFVGVMAISAIWYIVYARKREFRRPLQRRKGAD